MEKLIIINLITLVILVFLQCLKWYIKVKSKNLKENNYIDYLPGCNCGKCGYNSCLGMIKEMENNKKAYLMCKKIDKANKEKLTNMTKES